MQLIKKLKEHFGGHLKFIQTRQDEADGISAWEVRGRYNLCSIVVQKVANSFNLTIFRRPLMPVTFNGIDEPTSFNALVKTISDRVNLRLEEVLTKEVEPLRLAREAAQEKISG